MMRSRRPATIAALLAAAALGEARDAGAVGWMVSSGTEAREERVALAVSPGRTTLFSQLRVESQGGTFAIVVPVADGAALDWSSRAFFEALETSTAPRVIGPQGVEAACPGSDEPPAHVYTTP